MEGGLRQRCALFAMHATELPRILSPSIQRRQPIHQGNESRICVYDSLTKSLAIPKEECDCYILALKTTYLITDVEFLWLNSHSLVWRSCRKICSEEDELFFFSKILFVLPLHAMLSNSLWYAADFMSHRLIRFNFGNSICISKRQEKKGKTTVLETKLLIASFAWY